jgi:hypothetical protein
MPRYLVERNERVVGRGADLDAVCHAAQFEAVTHPGESVVVCEAGTGKPLIGWWEWSGDPRELEAGV